MEDFPKARTTTYNLTIESLGVLDTKSRSVYITFTPKKIPIILYNEFPKKMTSFLPECLVLGGDSSKGWVLL